MSFRVITKFERRESEDRLMFIRVKKIENQAKTSNLSVIGMNLTSITPC